jgi:hypothetical protein
MKLHKLILLSTLLFPLTTHAEMRSEIFGGYDGLSFDRHANDFIGTDEASDLEILQKMTRQKIL